MQLALSCYSFYFYLAKDQWAHALTFDVCPSTIHKNPPRAVKLFSETHAQWSPNGSSSKSKSIACEMCWICWVRWASTSVQFNFVWFPRWICFFQFVFRMGGISQGEDLNSNFDFYLTKVFLSLIVWTLATSAIESHPSQKVATPLRRSHDRS